jgi:hypothetical protein
MIAQLLLDELLEHAPTTSDEKSAPKATTHTLRMARSLTPPAAARSEASTEGAARSAAERARRGWAARAETSRRAEAQFVDAAFSADAAGFLDRRAVAGT